MPTPDTAHRGGVAAQDRHGIQAIKPDRRKQHTRKRHTRTRHRIQLQKQINAATVNSYQTPPEIAGKIAGNGHAVRLQVVAGYKPGKRQPNKKAVLDQKISRDPYYIRMKKRKNAVSEKKL